MPTILQAKRDLSLGAIKTVAIVDGTGITHLGFSVGWHIVFTYSDGSKEYLSDARRGNPRLFKSLDSANNALIHVGLNAECFVLT